MLNPLSELSLSQTPLPAHLERRQVIDFDHSLESALGDLEQCRSLVKSQQTDIVELLVHRNSPRAADAMAVPHKIRCKWLLSRLIYRARKDSAELNGQIWTMRDGARQPRQQENLFETEIVMGRITL
jgi:hypothetical protein